jgi:hypothetical protein
MMRWQTIKDCTCFALLAFLFLERPRALDLTTADGERVAISGGRCRGLWFDIRHGPNELVRRYKS